MFKIVASKIRIIPHSTQTRTACLRVELYGYVNVDRLVSYSIAPNDGEIRDVIAERTHSGEKLRTH